MKRIAIAGAVLAVIGLVIWLEPTGVVRGTLRGEAFVAGRPTSTWARRLLDTDPRAQKETLQELEQSGAAAAPVLLELMHRSEPELR